MSEFDLHQHSKEDTSAPPPIDTRPRDRTKVSVAMLAALVGLAAHFGGYAVTVGEGGLWGLICGAFAAAFLQSLILISFSRQAASVAFMHVFVTGSFGCIAAGLFISTLPESLVHPNSPLMNAAALAVLVPICAPFVFISWPLGVLLAKLVACATTASGHSSPRTRRRT